MLADLLEDNAALHETWRLARQAPDGLGAAAWHAADLRARTAHAAIRKACDDLAFAIARAGSLHAPHAELESALLRARAARNDPSTDAAERDALLALEQLLRLGVSGRPAIPRIVHLVRTDSSPEDLPLVQYLCYRSALAQCAGWRILLHAPTEPRGARWGKLLPHLELHLAPTPQWLGDRRLLAAAHQSDVWRVQQLLEHGGFYLDWDLLMLRSPEALREEVCVMALERKEQGYDEVLGVSFIGAQAGSPFLAAWLEAMPEVFNPRKYVAHSVALAHRLALRLPALVRVLGHRSFYHPGWTEPAMKWLFDPAERLPDDALKAHLSGSTGMHLFCSHANFLHWARDLGERDIAAGRSNFAALTRPYL